MATKKTVAKKRKFRMSSNPRLLTGYSARTVENSGGRQRRERDSSSAAVAPASPSDSTFLPPSERAGSAATALGVVARAGASSTAAAGVGVASAAASAVGSAVQHFASLLAAGRGTPPRVHGDPASSRSAPDPAPATFDPTADTQVPAAPAPGRATEDTLIAFTRSGRPAAAAAAPAESARRGPSGIPGVTGPTLAARAIGAGASSLARQRLGPGASQAAVDELSARLATGQASATEYLGPERGAAIEAVIAKAVRLGGPPASLAFTVVGGAGATAAINTPYERQKLQQSMTPLLGPISEMKQQMDAGAREQFRKDQGLPYDQEVIDKGRAVSLSVIPGAQALTGGGAGVGNLGPMGYLWEHESELVASAQRRYNATNTLGIDEAKAFIKSKDDYLAANPGRSLSSSEQEYYRQMQDQLAGNVPGGSRSAYLSGQTLPDRPEPEKPKSAAQLKFDKQKEADAAAAIQRQKDYEDKIAFEASQKENAKAIQAHQYKVQDLTKNYQATMEGILRVEGRHTAIAVAQQRVANYEAAAAMAAPATTRRVAAQTPDSVWASNVIKDFESSRVAHPLWKVKPEEQAAYDKAKAIAAQPGATVEVKVGGYKPYGNEEQNYKDAQALLRAVELEDRAPARQRMIERNTRRDRVGPSAIPATKDREPAAPASDKQRKDKDEAVLYTGPGRYAPPTPTPKEVAKMPRSGGGGSRKKR